MPKTENINKLPTVTKYWNSIFRCVIIWNSNWNQIRSIRWQFFRIWLNKGHSKSYQYSLYTKILRKEHSNNLTYKNMHSNSTGARWFTLATFHTNYNYSNSAAIYKPSKRITLIATWLRDESKNTRHVQHFYITPFRPPNVLTF